MVDMKKNFEKSLDAAIEDSEIKKNKVLKRFENAEKLFSNKEEQKIELEPIERMKTVTFTMPPEEVQLFEVCRQRAIGFNIVLNKSEIMRAGLAAINDASDNQFKKILSTLRRVERGYRSKKGTPK